MTRTKQPVERGCVQEELGESELLNHSVGYLLNQAARIIQVQTAEALTPWGIIPRHVGILETIAHHGELSQQEIGERLDIDRTSMVQFIDRLESLGMVERRTNPSDRRSYILCLTPEGQEALSGIRQVVMTIQERFLEPIRREEWERMRALLLKLLHGHLTGS